MQTQHVERYEQQNAHIRAQVSCAAACVEKLVARGLVVLTVVIEGRRPVVWVQNSSHCGDLSHGMVVRRMSERGVEQTMAAEVDGCQVQWLVVGH